VLTKDEANLAELKAGNPLGADQEVDLLQEGLLGERWQVGARIWISVLVFYRS
jgi:hypothetical protein